MRLTLRRSSELQKLSQNVLGPTPAHYATLFITHSRCMVLLQLERFGNIIYNLMYKYIYLKPHLQL